MTLDALADLAEASGLQVKRCSRWHLQLWGPTVKPVNVYQSARGDLTTHVSGSGPGLTDLAPSQIIALAQGTWDGPVSPERAPRLEGSDKHRRRVRLWIRGPRSCHWCQKPFTNPREATLEHLIPLSKGGSNRLDNLALACEPCNQARKNSLGAPPQPEPPSQGDPCHATHSTSPT